jgi:hypothetical protein
MDAGAKLSGQPIIPSGHALALILLAGVCLTIVGIVAIDRPVEAIEEILPL